MLKKATKIMGIIIAMVFIITSIVVTLKVDFSNPVNLKSFVHNKLNKTDVPGVSIAIIKNNEVEKYISYGYANINEGKKVNQDTVFQIASLSKVVTATAIMQLYEKKKINLDDEINKYLPFSVVNPNFPNESITVRMLLDHTSGIEDNWDILDSLYTIDSGGGDSEISIGEFSKEYLNEGGKWYSEEKNYTVNKPGTTFVYSNVGYGLLGYIVEQISQLPFDQYSQQYIFNPLGMTQTHWLHKDVTTENFAVPYEGSTALPKYSFPTYPDGSLKTNVVDFSKFLMSMSFPNKDNTSILKPETIKEMLSPYSNDGKQALGWSYSSLDEILMKKLNTGNIVGHTGSDPGVFTIALYNPEKKNGLVIFMNQEIGINIQTINIYLMIKRLVKEASL
ncbi:beta-lactamase family protein [Ornithinibacillus sp. BX22]|uniref:Beta-lactamase family protein n=2 Tax=Ornithinibacillus TaxID=484508 RepID=A0A923L909_9BACI|nr:MULTISPECIES: serine hydrolase domain-containing protein [Ornithinibacillus]MBC5638802.1 beta-lactamase family protein [Ornithinibacillus hominis]MBS3679797.1 beta-lactamase family protein [Ornithinibacillus massiliensis]